MFQGKVVVITGGNHGIGKRIAQRFKENGAHVAVMDVTAGDYFVGDAGKKEDLEAFVAYVLEKYGHADYLINNAPPGMKGIDDCTYEEFEAALRVGVTAPFYLSKLLMNHMPTGSAIVNISSSRDR
ncbi:MAG: SDR family oxidoreductase, partial [Clostridia bacterium]|nr:SDR family oxidoreductase [Clostridia bacterium]